MNLTEIVETVNTLDKECHIQILKFMIDNGVKINENKSGSFINLSMINDEIINKLNEFIEKLKENK
jgi:hypothetical protein